MVSLPVNFISHTIVTTVHYFHFTKDTEAYNMYLESALSIRIQWYEAVFYKLNKIVLCYFIKMDIIIIYFH